MANRRFSYFSLFGFVCAGLVAAPCLKAQTVQSANNSANYSTTVAQGSLFVLFGSGLGPATLVQVSAFPLPNALAGTSVTVTSGSTTLNCPMIYTSAGQVAAILPSNTPVGIVSITVSYNGKTAANGASTTQAVVVPNSVAIYTLASSGLGTGVFTALNGSVITYSASATPGQVIYVWGTGLGPISTPDNVLPPTFPNFPNVQVWVGGLAAQIIYGGRSGCCSGVDQIAFTVPAVVSGCNVPVTVVSNGSSSNTVTLPVNATAGACTDTFPAVPTSVLTKAIGGSANLAAIGLGPQLNSTKLFNQNSEKENPAISAQAAAELLSAALHTKVSETDAALLMRAFATNRPRAIRMAMSKYARQWKGLDAQEKYTLGTELTAREGVAAGFSTKSSISLTSQIVSAEFPTPGACVYLAQTQPSGLNGKDTTLDAGSSLVATGPGGSLTLKDSAAHKGNYSAPFTSGVSGPNVPPGTYTVSGSGGKNVGAFSASLTISSNLAISNKSALATVNRTQPTTVTWTGGVAGNYVLILGGTPSSGPYNPKTYFSCAAPAGAGTFTIPTYILASMNATATGKGVIILVPHPLQNQITIPGIDLAYFVDGSSDSVNVTFK